MDVGATRLDCNRKRACTRGLALQRTPKIIPALDRGLEISAQGDYRIESVHGIAVLCQNRGEEREGALVDRRIGDLVFFWMFEPKV